MSILYQNNNIKPLWAPVSTQDFFFRTITEDWHIFAGAVSFYFFCQFGSKHFMNAFSAKFRKFTEEEKNTWSVRFVSCVNSLICGRTAYLHVTQAYQLPSETDLYQTIPGHKLQMELISAYFIWDVIVCVMYKWGPIYTGHGIASGLGTYFSCWPFAERWVGWFAGTFELSNIFIHAAEMLTALDAAPALVSALKIVFSVLFLLIRPIAGTWVSCKFTIAAYDLIVTKNFERCHHPAAPIACLTVTWTLMALQYLWTGTILRGIGAALGLCKDPSAAEAGDTKTVETKKSQ